jgi:RNA polymerase sigma-70 factor, ECF subfamily
MAPTTTTSAPISATSDSDAWLKALRTAGPVRDQAVCFLHELLLRSAQFEVRRRRVAASYVRGDDLGDLATQAADDATVAVLRKLDDFRGASRFTTWANKFALLEASTRLRRRAWQNREVLLESDSWRHLAESSADPEMDAEQDELLLAIAECIGDELTPHQRQILVSAAIDGVPIDVLAERLHTTRGALYKAVHDARRKLRAVLAARGFRVEAAA